MLCSLSFPHVFVVSQALAQTAQSSAPLATANDAAKEHLSQFASPVAALQEGSDSLHREEAFAHNEASEVGLNANGHLMSLLCKAGLGLLLGLSAKQVGEVGWQGDRWSLRRRLELGSGSGRWQQTQALHLRRKVYMAQRLHRVGDNSALSHWVAGVQALDDHADRGKQALKRKLSLVKRLSVHLCFAKDCLLCFAVRSLASHSSSQVGVAGLLHIAGFSFQAVEDVL